MFLRMFFLVFSIYSFSVSSMDGVEQDHKLNESHKNSSAFYTKNLVGLPPNEDRIRQMADILNEKGVGGELNGKYFERGSYKDEVWIQRKIELIMGAYDKGLLSCRFFYKRGDLSQLVCFVNAELCYFEDKPDKSNDITLAWGANPVFQGQGLTSEALRGFVLADLFRDPSFNSVVLSIHPENKASIILSQKVLKAHLSWEGMNYSKTQPRHFYETSRADILESSRSFPVIEWGE